VKRHIGERADKCQFCGKCFWTPIQLQIHIKRIHTMEKEFTCPKPTCSYRAVRSCDLSKHIKIHRGEAA
jgi:uncharacterized Zn-finger protein